MKPTRLAAFLLALLLGVAPALAYPQNGLVPQQETYGSGFPDVKGTWCESYVQTVYESSLMEGKTKTSFDSRALLTNAQIITIGARLYDLLTGGDGEIPLIADASWYLTYYNNMAPLLGYESGSQILDMGVWPPTEACSRISFVNILSVVLKAAGVELPVVNEVAAIPDLNPMEALDGYTNTLAFYNAGILNGSDAYGTFRPLSSLTRGEAAAMLARLIDPAQRLRSSPAPFDFCKDLMGMEAETVVYSVNGKELAMDKFAPLLARNFFAAARLEDITFAGAAVPDAVTCALMDLRHAAALSVLAEIHGITLSAEAKATAASNAMAKAGFAGLDEQAWLSCELQEALGGAVESYYCEAYGYNSPLFHSDEPDGLSRLADDLEAVDVTIQSAGVMEGLDWAAIGQRAKTTPYAEYLFQRGV
ncbi:S-layer homology domain-containing protein [Oscillibacter sp. MSJ-2]|uniref:S-layer homology domain-containing protein n=1 Tax=Dysosmobacter acutus TaxID=2841504 RepID=A0ABS6F640_9FIRM|nr:S-layer homology domain-containing protein [Dysosmobacter acutus]MBU5625772.1 S-layer homology domain-containing protein [Dysosmobacter acutus]